MLCKAFFSLYKYLVSDFTGAKVKNFPCTVFDSINYEINDISEGKMKGKGKKTDTVINFCSVVLFYLRGY